MNIYFGILTSDKMNDTKSDFDCYSIQMYLDSVLQFKYVNDQLSFKEPRYVNSLIDYSEYYDTGKRYQLSRKQPGSKLSNYDTVLNNGNITLNDTNTHLVKYVITDFKGNNSFLTFNIKKDLDFKYQSTKENIDNDNSTIFFYNKNNTFKNDEVNINIPEGALYDNILFKYQINNKEKYLSKTYSIHDPHVPLHISYSLAIKADSVADSLKSKLIIVKINGNNKLISEGGKCIDGFVKANVNNFGKFAVYLDTVPPKIKPLNIKDQKNITEQKTIEIKITDELSGIKSYKAFLNSKWILMEYDAKNNLLTYAIDDNVKEGNNHFFLEVEDNKGNKSNYEAELFKYIY